MDTHRWWIFGYDDIYDKNKEEKMNKIFQFFIDAWNWKGLDDEGNKIK